MQLKKTDSVFIGVVLDQFFFWKRDSSFEIPWHIWHAYYSFLLFRYLWFSSYHSLVSPKVIKWLIENSFENHVFFKKKIIILILFFLYFFDRFDVLISKIIFKKRKNFILMYFRAKNTLKNNCYHTLKHL
jgi:hypothetical protein